MVTPLRRDATYADIEALPEGVPGQLLHGELYAHARPASPHLVVVSRLGSMLMPPFDRGLNGPGGWVILHGPEVHLGPRPDVVVPDLGGWRRARMPAVERVPWFSVAPDWICEVLSPGTTRVDRVLKLPIYAREAVGHAWLIDPVERSIAALKLEGGRRVLLAAVGEGAPVALEPFGALAIDLAYLWGL